VPLASQAVKILRDLHIETGHFELVFPAHRSPRRAISNNAILVALDRLAHAARDANGRAYNRTAHLEARKKMMQHWTDYLDELRMKVEASSTAPLVPVEVANQLSERRLRPSGSA
jgi:hypothetical protein